MKSELYLIYFLSETLRAAMVPILEKMKFCPMLYWSYSRICIVCKFQQLWPGAFFTIRKNPCIYLF